MLMFDILKFDQFKSVWTNTYLLGITYLKDCFLEPLGYLYSYK